MKIDTITAGDCAVLVSQLPDACIDLTVTSPPYDDLRRYNGYAWDFAAVAAQLWRVTKPGGVVVWVVGDATVNGSETGSSFRQALGFMELGFGVETMIYDTGNQGAKGANHLYSQAFEFMFVLAKGKPAGGSLIYDHKNIYGGTRNTSTRRRPNGNRRNERFVTPEFSKRTNVWYYPTGGGLSGDNLCHAHPAPFPEALARDHILSWSNPGDLVLDPFVGSGTTCKMAVETGRHFLGFDISEEYVELAKRRVNGARRPLLVVDVGTDGEADSTAVQRKLL